MSIVDYRPAPFWFLNHKLEKDEIIRQLQMMQNAGVSGFFIHPRAGLETPYMSSEWLDMIKLIVDEAEKRDLKAWLYDEDPFPSGAVGGRLFFDHPEFAARQIRFFAIKPDSSGNINADLGTGSVLSAVALKTSSGKTVGEIDISENIGVLRSDFFKSEWGNSYYAQIHNKKKYPHHRSETFYPHLQLNMVLPDCNWEVYVTTAEVLTYGKFSYLPDNLNKECVEYFIKNTHEKYKEKVGDKFGNVIPGIFTDEPAVGAPVPWTGKLEEIFESVHGYSISKKYHHIFKNIDNDSRILRKHYWEVVYKLFHDNYFSQIRDWCEVNSLKLCGHCIGEEDPLGTAGGSNTYGLQATMDIPGFDHITNNIPNGAFSSLNLGGKLIASAALQTGKRQVLSECFGCNPFNFGTEGMRKVTNWLFALGINWLVPHGFFYSYDGHRKFDAGRSFFFQHEDFGQFKEFAEYAERIGSRLGEADSLNHVCVLFPVSAFRSLLPAETELAQRIREHLFECVKSLLDRQVQFDLADEETLLNAELEAGIIRCGKQNYDSIVIPELEGVETDHIKSVINKYRALVPMVESPDGISKLPSLSGIIDISPNDHTLMTTVKTNSNGVLLYVFNNKSTPQKTNAKFNKNCAGCYILDNSSGEYFEISKEKSGYEFMVGGFEAAVVEFRKDKSDCPAYKLPTDLTDKEYSFEKNAEWEYIPPGEGWLATIHNWNIKIENSQTAETISNHHFCLCRELIGTELPHITSRLPRPIFDTVPLVSSNYPVRTEFSTDFKIASDFNSKKLLLVFENDTFVGNFRIFINGKELDQKLIRRQRIYDFMNKVAEINGYCKNGNNNISILFEQAGEFDGLRSSIYILLETS